MLDTGEDPNTIQDATRQLIGIIEARITDSFGDSGYGQALEELAVLREELTAMEEPGLYNDFIKSLKRKLLAEELGGDRREMWWEIRGARLGLIEKKVSSQTDVTEEEAKRVSGEHAYPDSMQVLMQKQFLSSK